MTARRRIVAGLGPIGLFFGCSPSPPAPTATRATTGTTSGLHPVQSTDEATTTTEAPTTTTELAPVTVTIAGLPAATPTTRRTTTTFVVPEATTVPDEFDARDAATARVSWYGAESGSHTANGDRYDPDGLTFAHLSMPFGTQVRFCGPLGCVVATCTDRGPSAWTGKTFDLSRGAFARIAPLSAGVITATWERVG